MNNIIEINKELVNKNIKLAAGDKKPCLMVKANCYGLGIEAIEMLIDSGYDYFGVSTIEEALEIREINKKVDILIVSYIDEEDFSIIKKNNFTITIYDLEMLSKVDSDILFHINFDTNMGRIGLTEDQIPEIKEIVNNRKLTIRGLYTHMACASDKGKTKQVIADFKKIVDEFLDYKVEYIHLFNSFSAINYNCDYDNMVRPGIGIWGYLATQTENSLSTKHYYPAIEVKLRISHVKQYDGFLSYDHIDKVKGKVYTVTAGYRDGIYPGFHHFSIPKVGKIVGKVNMCQFMVLADDSNLNKGDFFTFVRNEEIYNLCEYGDMTVYNFLTAFSNRYQIKII